MDLQVAKKDSTNIQKVDLYNQGSDGFLQEMIDGGQLPSYIKKINTAKCIAQYGKELGFAPMTAFNYIISIQGKLTLSAKAQQALLRRHGVTWRTLEDYFYCYSDGSVEETRVVKKDKEGKDMLPVDIRTSIEFKRDGITEVVRFYHSDAQAAELLNKDVWKKYKKSMFWARCFTTGATRIGSDLLLGLYGADEMFDALNLDEDMVIRDEKGEIVKIVDSDFTVEN